MEFLAAGVGLAHTWLLQALKSKPQPESESVQPHSFSHSHPVTPMPQFLPNKYPFKKNNKNVLSSKENSSESGGVCMFVIQL